MCGGTLKEQSCGRAISGLSPRVRGNLPRLRPPLPAEGTIPACAGEPPGRYSGPCAHRDYPRVCGGTWTRRRPPETSRGLSPRVRGNRARAEAAGVKIGTIPACAGEPGEGGREGRPDWDYPRVCGGTLYRQGKISVDEGLSPRVRGNPKARLHDLGDGGTIPACAGEPLALREIRGTTWDYPRVCGGTSAFQGAQATGKGLSPRVRGNLSRPSTRTMQRGTIPACAGEPHHFADSFPRGRDYPRVCGGTAPRFPILALRSGLSPRVRGNPLAGGNENDSAGTIPACAGEPYGFGACIGVPGDYPRVCGGTK